MSKNALVAGGAGFVGSHLCELLLTEGYSVTAIDNFITGRRSNIEHLFAKGLILVEGDINSDLTFDETFDEVYNLASPASPVDFAKLSTFILKTSAVGHTNMLELGRQHGARVLFASSSEVYGDAEVHPQVETYFGNVNTIGHRSCYDEAKRFGEALSVSYLREHKVDIRIARIFNTYGPHMRPNDGRIIPNFFIQALKGQSLTVYGDGSQTRSFCFVTDLVRGLYALMQSNETSPVNVGNPTERSVLEMAKVINEITDNKAPLKFLPLPENDPKQRRPDMAKAERIMAWRPKVDLESGLRQSLAYFKQQLELQPDVEAKNV